MKPRHQPAAETDLTDRKVAAHLRKHPHFFQRYPSLLHHVVFPHDAGAASSLVERQVRHLQEERRRLQGQLQELTQVARENERSMRRIHRLLLKLLRCTDLESLLKTLYVSLRAQFRVDAVSIRLHAEATPSWQGRMREFFGGERPFALLEELGVSKKPVCCVLNRQQAGILFGEPPTEMASYALIPLGNRRWRGVVCMGSGQAERFRDTYGSDLLQNLRDVLTTLVDVRLP